MIYMSQALGMLRTSQTYCFTVAREGPLDPRGIVKALYIGSPASDSEFTTLYSTMTELPEFAEPFIIFSAGWGRKVQMINASDLNLTRSLDTNSLQPF